MHQRIWRLPVGKVILEKIASPTQVVENRISQATHEMPQTNSQSEKSAVIPESCSIYLDFVRATAANLVVASHLILLYSDGDRHFTGGSIAVVLFFLLSGFLITWSAMGRRADAVGFAQFVSDRVARIATPYVPALVFAACISWISFSGQYSQPGISSGFTALLGNLLFLQDHPAFQGMAILGMDVSWRIRPYHGAEPFWTVAVEFWLYMAFGIVYFVVIAGVRSSGTVVWTLSILSIPTVLWHVGGGAGKGLTLVWFTGSMAAILIRAAITKFPTRTFGHIGAIILIAGALGCVARGMKYGVQDYDFQFATLMALILFGGLMLGWNLKSPPRPVRLAVTFLASYSYSLYLTHNTIIILLLEHPLTTDRFVNVIISIVACHLISIALYLLAERHHKRVSTLLFHPVATLLTPPKRQRP